MTEKKKPTFRRTNSTQYSKLGKKRKKKQVWRNPTGRHNKMRNQMKGHPATVSIGYSTDKVSRGKINEKVPVRIMNVKDLLKVGKNQIAVIGRIGKKNKIEIMKKAQEMKIEIHKTNPKNYLKRNEKKKVKEESKDKKESKKSESNKTKSEEESKK